MLVLPLHLHLDLTLALSGLDGGSAVAAFGADELALRLEELRKQNPEAVDRILDDVAAALERAAAGCPVGVRLGAGAKTWREAVEIGLGMTPQRAAGAPGIVWRGPRKG